MSYVTALTAYKKGRYLDAMSRLRKLKPVNEKEYFRRARLAMNCLFHLNEFAEAIPWAKQVVDIHPERHETWQSYGACLIRAGRIQEGIEALREARRRPGGDQNPEVYDGLTHAQGLKGNLRLVRQHGHRALELKSQPAEAKPLLSRHEDGRERKIVSYSLFGQKAKYLEGAVLNVEAAKRFYPGWQCRFYCDDRAAYRCRDRLIAAGAEVVIRGAVKDVKEALCWRFEVLDDVDVDRALFRDCDAIIGERESRLTQRWLESGKAFHVIRDSPTHSELMLAGLWGGLAGVVPNTRDLISEFRKQSKVVNTHYDQLFLREQIWPYAKENHLVHDAYFGYMTDAPGLEPVNDPELRVGRDLCRARLQTSLTEPKWEGYRWRISEGDSMICEYPLVFDGTKWTSEEIPNIYWLKLKQGVYSVEIVS